MYIALQATGYHSRRLAARRPMRKAPRLYRVRGTRHFFLRATAQHVRRPAPAADWLGAAAMLLGVASWGVLLSLLGA
jgi:hypothetical protein